MRRYKFQKKMPKKASKQNVEIEEKESELTKEEQANIASVQFTPPVTKEIISPHSGSILSSNEPEIELPDTIEKKARDLFNQYEELGGNKGYILKEKLQEMLNTLGYTLNNEILLHLIQTRCGTEQLDERQWLTFLERFQAPAYYYGQRLRQYCGRGQLQEVSELLVRGCEVNTGDGEGLTPLHYACESNRPEVIVKISSLVGNQLRVNVQDKYGWTPLHSACYHGNLDCVNLLLKLGADVTITEKVGKTCLHLAVAQVSSFSCFQFVSSRSHSVCCSDLHRQEMVSVICCCLTVPL